MPILNGLARWLNSTLQMLSTLLVVTPRLIVSLVLPPTNATAATPPLHVWAKWCSCIKLNLSSPLHVDPRDYSILQTDMPHRDNVDEPRKKQCLTFSVAGWLIPQYLACKDQSGVAAGASLTLQGWQSWFCQLLGVAPPALAPYA